jgi:hypothetical protein
LSLDTNDLPGDPLSLETSPEHGLLVPISEFIVAAVLLVQHQLAVFAIGIENGINSYSAYPDGYPIPVVCIGEEFAKWFFGSSRAHFSLCVCASVSQTE